MRACADLVVGPDMEPYDAEHQGNDSEEDTCKARSADETGHYRLIRIKG